ncbi:MAG: 2-C-methyl-D-erythritol 4-phosphate cytidylyltransferase [Bacillaceae bacterium]
MKQYTVIIPAAGSGKRMGASQNKLFLQLGNVPIIVHTVKQFLKDEACVQIRLVINFQEKAIFEELMKTYALTEKVVLIEGGSERQESVYKGMQGDFQTDYVLVHDGARPFVSMEIINRVIEGIQMEGAATCGVPVKDTIKRVQNGIIEETMDRSLLWAIQTPQGFVHKDLLHAHEQAAEQGFLVTDDASLIEWAGKKVCVVMGDYRNIKVTTPEDLIIGESFLAQR